MKTIRIRTTGCEGLIGEGEARFAEQLHSLTESLAAQSDLRMIGLTGPTCSGKTTAAAMITEALAARGKTVKIISIDDFYFEKSYLEELTQKKGRKTLDYDSEDTIDVELLRDCADRLRDGAQVQLPRFNFVTGRREQGDTICPEEQDVFLFEGIQVLYPAVDAILRGEGYKSIFIAPQSALEWQGRLVLPNELRLMRRLVRDAYFRDTDAAFTLYLWPGVRENEEKSIFPHADRCDYHVDSTMPYELCILKPYLVRELGKIPRSDPRAAEADALLKGLEELPVLSKDLLPEKSLYKEFIAL